MKKLNWITLFVITFCLCTVFVTESSEAMIDNLRCYKIESTDTPFSTVDPGLRTETWCYGKTSSPQDSYVVFNLDNGTVRPELLAVVEPDGTITHGSLLKGKLSVHRLKGNYNPLAMSLTPPEHAEEMMIAADDQLLSSAKSVLKYFANATIINEDLSVQDQPIGTLAVVSASIIPFRGYWWPYSSGRLHYGSMSPLAKFDRYVKARTGKNPGAQAWEKANHRYEGIKWSGHCNGWAASSILRASPRAGRKDPVSGVYFSVSDLKGLMAEKDNCVKFAFFGRRYTSSAGGNPSDINPVEFHNTITYYIGRLRKPLVMDRLRYAAVDNHVVSGYSMSLKRTSSTTMTVSTTLTVHGYDKQITNVVSKAPSYRKTYQYKLWLRENGQIVKGQWLTGNPDFLWVPLSPSQCSPSNPIVTQNWIDQIMRR